MTSSASIGFIHKFIIYEYQKYPQELKGAIGFIELAKRHPDKTFIMSGQADIHDNILYVESSIPIGGTRERERIRINLLDIPNLSFVGVSGDKQRKELLGKATALIQLTEYQEPFGFNVVEALLSGTPVLTDDQGGFLDTVVNGYNGYRVSHRDKLLIDFYLDKLHLINPKDCLKSALTRYSKDRIIRAYESYFETLIHKYVLPVKV